MTLYPTLLYKNPISTIYIILAVTGITFVLTSIWAIYDLSRRKGISRKEKSSLTFLVIKWPIYGIIWYVLKIRKTLPKE